MLDNERKLQLEISKLKKELWLRSNLAHVVSTYTQPDELLPNMIRFLTDGFGAAGGAIYFMEKESDLITVRATYGLDPSYALSYHSIDLGSHVTGMVAETGEGMLVKDSSMDLRSTQQVVSMLKYRSAMVIPVTSGGEVVGIIALISEKPNFFTESDLKLLEFMGGHISLSIINSLLNKEIAQEKKMIEDILERVDEGIFEAVVKVPRGREKRIDELVSGFLRSCRFTLMNSSFLQQCGKDVTTGQLIRKGFDPGTLDLLLPELLEKGEPTLMERNMIDGKERVYEVSVVRMDEDEGIKGIKGIRRDITKRVKAEWALHESKDQTELYLDILSHDISNINTVSIGFLELLFERPDLTPMSRSYVTSSLDAIRKSSQLVGKVRTFSKIQKGPKDLEAVDIRDSFHRMAEMVKKEHPDKKVQIKARLGKSPIMVKSDELVDEMFYHVLKNAVVHNPRETVLVEVLVRRCSRNGLDGYSIGINDRGEGIPDEMKKNIFDRFYHTQSIAPDNCLGLSIVKGIVERFGGEAWVEDRMKGDHSQGASFKIFLPKA